jgi:BioD-like phosphotransacetylase family protein
MVHSAFALKDDPRTMYAVTRKEAVGLLAQDKGDELLDRIYTAYEEYSEKHDLVVIEGTHEGRRLLQRLSIM